MHSGRGCLDQLLLPVTAIAGDHDDGDAAAPKVTRSGLRIPLRQTSATAASGEGEASMHGLYSLCMFCRAGAGCRLWLQLVCLRRFRFRCATEYSCLSAVALGPSFCPSARAQASSSQTICDHSILFLFSRHPSHRRSSATIHGPGPVPIRSRKAGICIARARSVNGHP